MSAQFNLKTNTDFQIKTKCSNRKKNSQNNLLIKVFQSVNIKILS